MNEDLILTSANGRPVFILLAGPNGSGKSTFRERRLRLLGLECIDPDEVALDIFGRQALTRDEARSATIEATRQVNVYLSRGESICLETVFSDRNGHKKALVQEARSKGYYTVLIFIGVDSPEISVARVAQRVLDGGHDIPDDIIKRRFPSAFQNARDMLPIADLSLLYDNSGAYDGTNLPMRHTHVATFAGAKKLELRHPLPAWFSLHEFDTAIRD